MSKEPCGQLGMKDEEVNMRMGLSIEILLLAYDLIAFNGDMIKLYASSSKLK